MQPSLSALQEWLSSRLDIPVSTMAILPVAGGSINRSFCLEINEGQRFFCKINEELAFPGLFLREEEGLELLARRSQVRVPQVIGVGHLEGQQILVLEWIQTGQESESFWKLFGRQLALQHEETGAGFGLDEDNWMGSLPQSNRFLPSWLEFFTQQRLEPQLRRPVDQHFLNSRDVLQFQRLYGRLAGIFPDLPPALVHGDLWSGNYLCDEKEQPVLIDPAAYFGHPSVDLGMTTLFGRFHPSFYSAYNEVSPLPSNHSEQWAVSNLYPLLIHVNLFGGRYVPMVRKTIAKF
jgi:protein-ribulosamine 3-kinase